MPKMLILAPTFVPGDEQPQHLPEFTFHSTNTDTAKRLAEAQKALYVEGKDDHTRRAQAREGVFTASDALIRRVEDVIQARELAEAEAEAKAKQPARA